MSAIAIEDTSVLVKSDKYTTTVLPDGNWLFLDQNENHVVVVTATVGVFWELCSGDKDLDSLVSEMSALYPEQNTKKIRQDIADIIPELIKHDLLLNTEEKSN